MPKAILEFDLTDPDDIQSYRVANDAHKILSALRSYDEQLRQWAKYGATFSSVSEVLDEARRRLHSALQEEGVSLYE